jgi:hypothetical protein
MKSTSSSTIALKPYLEAMKAHCEGLSKEDLIKTILRLAQEVEVGGRGEFLDKIRALSPGAASETRGMETNMEEVLLDRIAALREEIEQRISSIEDGTYWDHADWEEQGYDDEDPDRVTEEQVDELEHLFFETGRTFLAGHLKTARRLYFDLFALLHSDEEVPLGFSRQSLDLREGRARYCRCVYETAEPARRVEEFFQCMGVGAAMNSYRLDLSSEPFPMLQDVIDARPGDLPDLSSFLPAWERRLASSRTSRGAVLRMEALERLEGKEGLSRLARQWKSEQPIGYLFWIQCLEGKGDWHGMFDSCLEALEVLPMSGFREQAAGYLVKAATELGDANAVLRGKRERFLSAPDERNLIGHLEEAEKQDVRTRELEAALASRPQIEASQGGLGDLYIKMLLMAGKLDDAFNLGKDGASIGWSFGKVGILFSSVLSVLTESSPKATVVQALLREYAEETYSFHHGDGEGEGREMIHGEIARGLASIRLSQSEKEKYSAWAERIGRDRVERIVSGKHRRAYDRAAQVLGALAEYHVLSNARDKALSLLNEFLRVKFPRHHAFRTEAKHVMQGTELLRDLRVV